jgi:hypothetical protein
MIFKWLAHKLGLEKCPQCETLVDYALDGLESDQRSSVRRHLSDCPSCMEQVRDYWQVKEGLGLCAPEASEPKDLSAKVLARLKQDHNAQQGASPRAALHLGGWPRFWMTVGPVFAGMSFVMTLVALGALLGRGVQAPETLASAPMDELAELSREMMNDPKASRIRLVAAGPAKDSVGDLVLCPGRKQAFFKASHLSKCAQGRNYALWMKPRQGEPKRLARFTVEADGSSMHLLNLGEPWAGTEAVDFMVTQDSGPKAGDTWLTGSLKL